MPTKTLTVTDARIFEHSIGECVSVGGTVYRLKKVLSDTELEVETLNG